MDSLPYRHLRTLMAAPGLVRAIRIGSRPSAKALASLEGRGLAGGARQPLRVPAGSGCREWRMATDQGSPLYRRLLVGQVPERLAQRLASLTDGGFRLELVNRSALSSSDILRLVNEGRSFHCGYVDI